MQPSRVFMKEYPIGAVKHTDSMVRIPATPLNQQLQQLIHHSLDTHAHTVLKGAQFYFVCVFVCVSVFQCLKKCHKLITKC